MIYAEIVRTIADVLKDYDSTSPSHKSFKPGIGPFGEPQIVRVIARRLVDRGMQAKTKRVPDLDIQGEWAIEFKIVRPFGDNGQEAENWSVNMLHPYEGNISLIGDALKLSNLATYAHKGLFVIGFEHNPPIIRLDPLITSFETIAREVMQIRLGQRLEERRDALIHPEHQVLRCFGWEVDP